MRRAPDILLTILGTEGEKIAATLEALSRILSSGRDMDRVRIHIYGPAPEATRKLLRQFKGQHLSESPPSSEGGLFEILSPHHAIYYIVLEGGVVPHPHLIPVATASWDVIQDDHKGLLGLSGGRPRPTTMSADQVETSTPTIFQAKSFIVGRLGLGRLQDPEVQHYTTEHDLVSGGVRNESSTTANRIQPSMARRQTIVRSRAIPEPLPKPIPEPVLIPPQVQVAPVAKKPLELVAGKAAFLVATHHRPALLRICLQTLSIQTVPPGWTYEILVAGEPTDLGRWEAGDFDKTRFVSVESSWVTTKLNRLLQETDAELVILADDDDLQPQGRLTAAVTAFMGGFEWAGSRVCHFYHVAQDSLTRWEGPRVGLIGTSLSFSTKLLREINGWPELERGKDGPLVDRIQRLERRPVPADLTEDLEKTLCLQHGKNLWERPVVEKGSSTSKGTFQIKGQGRLTENQAFVTWFPLLQDLTPSGRTIKENTPPPTPKKVSVPKRLHVACGPKHIQDYLNTDLRPGPSVDQVLDAREALPADTYDEIYACHVLEHFYPDETPQVLANWFQALQPGGTLRLSVPDLRLILANCVESHAFGKDLNAPLFGDYRKAALEPDRHKQAFVLETLTGLLTAAGFTEVRTWRSPEVPEIHAVADWSSWETISLNLIGQRPPEPVPSPTRPGPTRPTPIPPPPPVRPHPVVVSEAKHPVMDCSVLLGTVNRPEMLQECIASVRQSLKGSGYTYEIVVAYGTESDVSLPWLRTQPDVKPVLGGMEGAIPAFNRAYESSKGRLICQINDDVLIDGDSIARAIQYLDAESACAGVVFKFDREDGQGLRNMYMNGHLHPNQILVRRPACEAVVEQIGAFWGDGNHRTDKTYGGDSAFGALCHHLGLPLVALDDVTCHDRVQETNDALRERNKQVDPKHSQTWPSKYFPMLRSDPVLPGPNEWPNLYVPRPGMPPRRSPLEAGVPFRLLHLSLQNGYEPQEDLRRAFARIGPYCEVPWETLSRESGREAAERTILETAAKHRPDLVWAQVQRHAWTADFMRKLRRVVGPKCLLCQWTGDVQTGGDQPVMRWLVEMGQHFDLMLADTVTYPRKLALEEKVPAACGYLACGIDPSVNSWDPSMAETADVVFCGTNYRVLDGGARESLFEQVQRGLPNRLTIYGMGWEKSRVAQQARPVISQREAARVMRQAKITLSTSLYQNLVRYSSDRLKRAMASGACVAVQAFPDMEGLGLVDGVNCLVWNTPADLIKLLKKWTRPELEAERFAIREQATQLAHTRFTWDRVTEELLAIVRDVRERRGA